MRIIGSLLVALGMAWAAPLIGVKDSSPQLERFQQTPFCRTYGCKFQARVVDDPLLNVVKYHFDLTRLGGAPGQIRLRPPLLQQGSGKPPRLGQDRGVLVPGQLLPLPWPQREHLGVPGQGLAAGLEGSAGSSKFSAHLPQLGEKHGLEGLFQIPHPRRAPAATLVSNHPRNRAPGFPREPVGPGWPEAKARGRRGWGR